MKLESVSINRFRSIDSNQLSNCGDFNVLIGKNNSGKSSILSAINAFFTCIQSDNVVTLDPLIGQEIDFFKRETQLPIEITITFSLSLAERDALIRDIVTEAPQMRNAVDGIDPSLRLSVSLKITPPPNNFGFFSKLALGGTVRPGAKRPDPESIILEIGNEAASELYGKLSRYRQQNKDAETLNAIKSRIDPDDWSRLKERRTAIPLSYSLSRIFTSEISDNISKELRQILESITSESASYEDFSRAVSTTVTKMKEEAVAVQEEVLKNKICTFSGDEPSIPNYAQSLLCRISKIKILHLTERREPIGKKEAERLLSLKVQRGGTEVLHNIQETVSALLGVQVDAFQSSSASRRGDTSAEMDVDNFLVEMNGSGIREALRLVLDVEFGHPDILLVEEPEIHLHPALETSMMRYLKRISPDCQVFITTHSTNFLDTAEMKNVYLVSKPDSTQVQQLDVEEAEAQIPKELGIRLSSLFMFDRIVFVEGQSDEDILREWASTLRVNLSQSNVGFIAMGGVRNFVHYAAEATLSFLTKRQIKIWFLMDRDEREDSEISNFQKALSQKATVKFLNKREIENYLICYRAIVDFIKLKKNFSGNQIYEELPTEFEIKGKIEECAEKLKQMAIVKRVAKALCKPVYPSFTQIFDEAQETAVVNRVTDEIQRMIEQLEQEQGEVEAVYKEKSESVNSVWQSSKLDIVPGDLLLDNVCQEYGVRFKKERDGARLAALMSESEINEDIKQIIDEIGS